MLKTKILHVVAIVEDEKERQVTVEEVDSPNFVATCPNCRCMFGGKRHE